MHTDCRPGYTWLARWVHARNIRSQARAGLTQYLLSCMLPDPHVRRFLRPPAQGLLETRALCHLSRAPVEVGWACSVCLTALQLGHTRRPVSGRTQRQGRPPAARDAASPLRTAALWAPEQSHRSLGPFRGTAKGARLTVCLAMQVFADDKRSVLPECPVCATRFTLNLHPSARPPKKKVQKKKAQPAAAAAAALGPASAPPPAPAITPAPPDATLAGMADWQRT